MPTDGDGAISADAARRFPTRYLPPPQVRDLPAPPLHQWRYVGPGIIAAGETALTGFSGLWRHWGLVFAILAYFANIRPAWATSSATLISYMYMFGGSAAVIAVVILVIVGGILTLAPVVHTALERAQMVKVAAVALLVVVGALFAVGSAWADVPRIVTEVQFPVAELGFELAGGG